MERRVWLHCGIAGLLALAVLAVGLPLYPGAGTTATVHSPASELAQPEEHGRKPGFIEFHRRLLDSWLRFEGWTQYSINLTLGGDPRRPVSLSIAAALWVGLTLLLLLGYYRMRGQPIPRLAPLIVLACAWLLVDARWQLDLNRQLTLTKAQYADKSSAEKIPDVPGKDQLLALIDRAGESLIPEARVLIVSEQDFYRRYARYRLLPLAAFFSNDFRPGVYHNLRTDDGILLIGSSDARPDRIDPRMTSDWQDKLPLRFAPEDLPHPSGTLITDADSPSGTALIARSGEGNQQLHRGPRHAAPPRGYYRVVFRIRSAESIPVRVRLLVRQWPSDRQDATLLADRFVYLVGTGYRDYDLPFVVTDEGPIEYLLSAPGGTRSAGVQLEILNDPGDLAFLNQGGEPPHTVVQILEFAGPLGVLFKVQ